MSPRPSIPKLLANNPFSSRSIGNITKGEREREGGGGGGGKSVKYVVSLPPPPHSPLRACRGSNCY